MLKGEEMEIKITITKDLETSIMNIDFGPIAWDFELTPEKAEVALQEFKKASGMLENFLYFQKQKGDEDEGVLCL